MAHDQTWHSTRALAETVPCRYCKQPTGATCVRTGPDGLPGPAQNFPAHQIRIDDAHDSTQWKEKV